MKRYFAKPDTWFKEGTECFLVEELCPHGWLSNEKGEPISTGVYRGTYIVGTCSKFQRDGYDELWYRQGYKDHDEVVMNEHCGSDEFDEIEEGESK